MQKKWWNKLLLGCLAGFAPYLCLVGFFELTVNDDYLPAWFVLSGGCGFAAGLTCRLWSVAGAALTAGVVFSAAFYFGDTHRDGGIVVMLGFMAAMAYAAGLLVGVPAAFLWRFFAKRV